MFKLIKRVIYILIIVGVVFMVLSLWQGGGPFRWFGNKSEKAGDIIKEKSEEIGKEADKIKGETEKIKGATKRVAEGIKKQEKKIKDIAGSNDEK